MNRVRVETDPGYDVLVGPGALERAAAEVGNRRAAVVTDANVAPLHAARLGPLAEAPRLVLEPGEETKRLATVERLLDFLAASDLDRGSVVLALGGGVVGDLAGLAASLYMRGIGVLQCPTSLLAQCDAAIGGKTGVDLTAGKNLAGTIHQPEAVLADTAVLATLPAEELRSGLGEVVKTALVGDPALLPLLEEGAPRLLGRDPELLMEVVARCAAVKGAVVAADELEHGARRTLNLGHTFGHAIELVAGYGTVPHGEAVAVGLALAAAVSARSGHLADPELPERLERLLERLGLSPTLAGLRERLGLALPAGELVEAMRHDKKGRAGEPELVLPEAAGRLRAGCVVERALLDAVLA